MTVEKARFPAKIETSASRICLQVTSAMRPKPRIEAMILPIKPNFISGFSFALEIARCHLKKRQRGPLAAEHENNFYLNITHKKTGPNPGPVFKCLDYLRSRNGNLTNDYHYGLRRHIRHGHRRDHCIHDFHAEPADVPPKQSSHDLQSRHH